MYFLTKKRGLKIKRCLTLIEICFVAHLPNMVIVSIHDHKINEFLQFLHGFLYQIYHISTIMLKTYNRTPIY